MESISDDFAMTLMKKGKTLQEKRHTGVKAAARLKKIQ
jgi:hypothetical protein